MGEHHLRLAAPLETPEHPSAVDDVTRVLLAEGHTLMRRTLRELLDSEQDIEVIAEASELPSIEQEVRKHRPGVLVVDLGMLDGSSSKVISRLRQLAPDTQIVMVTMQDNPAFAQATLAAGALGFVLKDFAEEDLARAIRAAVRGEPHISSSMGPRGADAAITSATNSLSARELEVLRLIALGHTNVEIAHKLDVSPRTVETHRARIHHKLELRTRAELVRYALTLGLLRS